MIAVDEARRLALLHAEAYEADHHGFPSFRVGGRIFATLPDGEHLHAMIGADEIRALTVAEPAAYEEKWGATGWPASVSTCTEPTRPKSPSCSPKRGLRRRPAA